MSQALQTARPDFLTLRHNGLTPLSDSAIRAFAPAVFTDHPRPALPNRPSAAMSDSYQFVPTYEIHRELLAQGFVTHEVQTYWRKVTAYRPYAMHLLRYGLPGAKTALKERGDTIPEIVLRNSHDGSAHLEFYAGVFRLVCSNGLIVSDTGAVQPISVRHSTNSVLAAMSAVHELIEQQRAVFDHVEAMRKTTLTQVQQVEFAARALQLHTGASNIDPERLLVARRPEDADPNVWLVFNRVQEHLVRGGIEGTAGNGRRTVTRGTGTLWRQLELNASLWSLAMEAIGRAQASSQLVVSAQRRAQASAARRAEDAALRAELG